MGYHTAREIPNYWAYAETYTLHDRMFAPTDSWTLPGPPVPDLGVVGDDARCPTIPMACVSDQRNPGRRPGLESKNWTPDAGEPLPYIWADITWLLYKAGVSWGYFVGPGSCVVAPCEDFEATETRAVQNPLPGLPHGRRDRPARQRAAEHRLPRSGARGHAAERLVGDADRAAGRAPARLDRRRAGVGDRDRERGDARARGAVDAHGDLRDVGRLGRLLRPRASRRWSTRTDGGSACPRS